MAGWRDGRLVGGRLVDWVVGGWWVVDGGWWVVGGGGGVVGGGWVVGGGLWVVGGGCGGGGGGGCAWCELCLGAASCLLSGAWIQPPPGAGWAELGRCFG